jgi:hypothetical protein
MMSRVTFEFRNPLNFPSSARDWQYGMNQKPLQRIIQIATGSDVCIIRRIGPILDKRVGARRNAFLGVEMLLFILAIVLIMALVGSIPKWPHSREWGYYPSGGVGLVLVILLVLYLLGRL